MCDLDKPFPDRARLRDATQRASAAAPDRACSRREVVADDFDARFSAKKRHYLYRITNHRANLALDIKRSWRVPRHLDTDAMHVAAQRLLGKHDFTTFRDTECQAKSPEKTLDQLDVVREGDEVSILTSARSFLHSQVRSMVGSLVLGRRRPLERPRPRRRSSRPQPRRLRPGGAAGRIVSGAGGVLGLRRHTPRRRGIQYAAAAVIDRDVPAYWIVCLRGR